ncbi:hypothetical protein [uncultured Pseudomonas sp.]|uniref:hypothetical protein n=1 Tax=uncultured Pseudomonas sp. TaxID=114707 RepID=UPI0025D8B412|nr:hypothetical protein [uncultured Pseudomonas sp.]
MISKEINGREPGNLYSLQAAIEDFACLTSSLENEHDLRTEIIQLLHRYAAHGSQTTAHLADHTQGLTSEAHERALKAMARLFVECANISLEQALATKRRRLFGIDYSLRD